MNQTGTHEIEADVCIVGGGPAGLMLGLRLAQLGRRAIVVEQATNFERSFRGESISPDSVWLLRRHGILDEVGAENLFEVRRLALFDGGTQVLGVDFSEFNHPQPYPIELPQPLLLGALARVGKRHPGFQLLLGTRVEKLLIRDGAVSGLSARRGEEWLQIRAAAVVGADGRFSRTRTMAGIEFEKQPLERDFLWFKVPCPRSWDHRAYAVHLRGDAQAVVIPTYPDLLRVGFNIPKGQLKALRAEGIGGLHRRVDELIPALGQTVREGVPSWRQTSVLDIFTSTAPSWHRGRVVLVGDAAHTLSPVLAQGVNHAIIDAVVLAPELAQALDSDAERLSEAFASYQGQRESKVDAARKIQLRQERAFAFKGALATRTRRAVYRRLDRSDRAKRRIWGKLYYDLQRSEAVPGAEAPGDRVSELKDFAKLHARAQGIHKATTADVLERIESDGEGKGSWVATWSEVGGIAAAAKRDLEAAALFGLARFPYVDGPARLAAHRNSVEAFERWRRQHTVSERRTVTTPGGGFAYYATPPSQLPDRPLVLVIGGIVSPKEQWGKFLQMGRRLGMAVVVTEMPGVGENELTYEAESWRFLKELLDDYEAAGSAPRRAYVLGLSFGGHLALCCALHDARIAALLTVGAPIDAFFRHPGWERRVPPITKRTLAHLTGLEEERLPGELDGWGLGAAELERLEIPIRYVASSRDEVIPAADPISLIRYAPGARIVEFDDVHGSPDHLAQTRAWLARSLFEIEGGGKLRSRLLDVYLRARGVAPNGGDAKDRHLA